MQGLASYHRGAFLHLESRKAALQPHARLPVQAAFIRECFPVAPHDVMSSVAFTLACCKLQSCWLNCACALQMILSDTTLKGKHPHIMTT